jgi:sugar lactone lactonase YvrE
MNKRIAFTGLFVLFFASLLFITSCGGGAGSSPGGGGGGFGGPSDGSPDPVDFSDDSSDPADSSEESLDDGTPTNNPVNTGVNTAVDSLSFDLTGAVGLAIDNSSPPIARGTDFSTGVSNLKRVNPDNSLSDAIRSGSATVQSFMVAANNQVYLLLSSPVDSCILVRVDGNTNESSCVDSTLSQINWNNAFGDPIQFDGNGNIYYQGNASGSTILRENSSGTTTDLINSNISLKGFLVLNDGTVFVTGRTNSTGTQWTRIITPEGSLENLLTIQPDFLALFPDNNVYIQGAQGFTLARYLTATDEFDPIGWIDQTQEAYYACPPDVSCYYNNFNPTNSILKTTNGEVFINNGRLIQYYPIVSAVNTTIADVTVSKSILTYILLAGLDSDEANKLVLYDTATDTETDLLGGEDIEVYHVNYLNSSSHQTVMFDGLRFSDNEYVLCQIDLTDNNTLICSKTDTGKLTDFQLFDDSKIIAGGGTNATKTYTVGGTVTGLYGTLVLQNNGTDTLTLTGDGVFTFPIAVDSEFNVTVKSNPQSQLCTVSNGMGIVSSDHVTSVTVVCSLAIDGTVTGLEGTLVLRNNLVDTLTVAENGSFKFPVADPHYKITVKSNPQGQLCIVSNASGTVAVDRLSSVSISCSPAAGRIITVAGNGSSSSSGDGGLATNAGMNYPRGITFDSLGNLFISETSVRKVDTNGIITSIAGTSGWSGNIAFDSLDNLYIAICGTQPLVRKMDRNGVITTVAGNGTVGFSGDGGQAINAQLYCPSGIAFDSSDNLYIADLGNARIRKVDSNGIITTIAGNGTQGFSGDGGQAIDAGLYFPSGITFDSSDNLYVADSGNNRIRKVDTSGIITTIAGNGTQGFSGDGGQAIDAGLYFPSGITFDSSGNLYIADVNNHRVRKINTTGAITTVAGNGSGGFSGDGGLATSAALGSGGGIAFDSSGNLYIGDSSNNRIRMVFGE